MTTAIFALDLDQQPCGTQAAMVAPQTAIGIALELFISGEGDGFDGVYPGSLDLAYMSGYSRGLRRKMADIQHQAEMLEAEGLAVEATVEAMFAEKIPF